MSNRTLDRLESRVGATVESVEGFTVEGGKVAEFAAAVGDDDPVFRDPEAAADRGFERRPAPPTFTRSSMFPRYRPDGVGRLGFDLGFDIRYELHGEQAYEFARPVYVGDTLSATTTLTDAYEREGRQGGTMTFAVLETEYVDAGGAPVVTERETLIETDGPVAESDRDPDPIDRDATPDGASVRQPVAGFEPVDSVADVAVGDAGPTVIVEELVPQDFVRYAGASGDFNPIHYDERYTRALGNRSVFGQGMLVAGYAGHLVTDWFGVAAIRRFRTRFTARAWPGDTLTVTGEVTGVDAPEVTAELTATRQTGQTVLLGDVTATIPTADRA
ncbi:MaoC family dehydratase N-terminal domain-containing protein [Halomarina halobia]|uniref:MaoC family dehydratase N-terminal domain-containing protein n=1 Tax=Halomarina halobia TaxID=3033386 RepID=A0ABD6ADX0_9EURY|nr:MaoC family dehydratase N-terminal domain-containing protein [Halomarina sp. PSR21]